MRTSLQGKEWHFEILLTLLAFLQAGMMAAQPSDSPNAALFTSARKAIATSSIQVELSRFSGTVTHLNPASQPSFDYTPGDLLRQRSDDTFYHLGDLDLRIRRVGDGAWRPMSTAYRRRMVNVVSDQPNEYRTDVTNSLPKDAGIRVIRSWRAGPDDLQLRFTITNTGSTSLEMGGVGIPMVFNNILTGRTLEQSYEKCSFYDPYIGEDAGYVQVVPLKGTGPVLLVTPLGHSPMEAWKPILDEIDKPSGLGRMEGDPTPRSVTFEGSFDWMIHTKAFEEHEWKGVREWNPATSVWLAPKKSIEFGLRFFIAPDIRSVDSTLISHQRPVAIGIPGYVLPQDIEGRLFLNYANPVHTLEVEPSGSIAIRDDGRLPSGLHAYTAHGIIWGDSRLKVTYQDGTVQTISYRVIKPERQTIQDLGTFLSHQQWFEDGKDPFGRSTSFITYDNEARRQVLQDRRVWIAGLSDEGGAGAYLAEAMKELLEPDREEVAKLETFVDGVLWGHLQISQGDHQYGVRKSLFFYDPAEFPNFKYVPDVNTKNGSWDRHEAFRLDRTYNYPHVVAAYWALFRIARNTEGVTTKHDWQWYLDHAYRTTLAMRSEANLFDRFGLMEGTIFTYLLEDLRKEGWNDKAKNLEEYMRGRAERWRSEAYPFGSEMPWDSTGQEEVYAWSKFFGYSDKAQVTLNAILAYDPTIPNWGYNGSARRYWDFGTAGKWTRIERQLHHYGSGLNAIPILAEYREHSEDLYLLRVGYGGVMGPLTNINQQGFGSAAFHSFPDRMTFDPYSGDYGSNLFGHALNTAVYVAHDDSMGWLCFGGNLRQGEDWIDVSILDSSRRRVFLSPLKLWISLDSGEIRSVRFDEKHGIVQLQLEPANSAERQARIHLEDFDGQKARAWRMDGHRPQQNNEYDIPLTSGKIAVEIRR